MPTSSNKILGLSTWQYTIIFCVLIGFSIGYITGTIDERKRSATGVKHTATETWFALSLQQAKAGDFAITKNGEVFRLGSSIRKAVVESDNVYYNTRMTSGGYHVKPLWQMARDTVAVINPTHSEYFGVDQCFSTGKVVTTVGPEKWACGG